MKQNVTLVFCRTQAETKWAISFLKLHSDKKVIILASSLKAQLILKRNNIRSDHIYELDGSNKNLVKSLKNVYSKAKQACIQFEKAAQHLQLTYKNINLVTLASDILLFKYSELILSEILFQKINSKWSPHALFIPETTIESGEDRDLIFPLVSYIQQHANTKKVHMYFVSEPARNLWFERLLEITSQPILIKYWLENKLLSLQSFIHAATAKQKPKRYTILMQTGGAITSYFYDLFKLLDSKYNFYLYAYKLKSYQAIPLRKHHIRFFNFDTTTSTKSLSSNIYDRISSGLSKLTQHSYSLAFLHSNRLESALIQETIRLIKNRLPELLKKIDINQELLQTTKPDLVINTHDPSPTGLALVMPAQKLQIPTLLLLHGLPMEIVYRKTKSDYMQVWGKQTFNHYKMDSNRKISSIFSTGFTKLDEYVNLIHKTQKINKSFTSALKIGFIFTSYSPFDMYISRFIHTLFCKLGNTDMHLQINYRWHEGFIYKGLSKVGNYYGLKTCDKTLQNLDLFIRENDLIVCWDTTAILWAMFYHKPLIHCIIDWSQPILPTEKYKAAWSPKTVDDFVKILSNFYTKPQIAHNLVAGQNHFLSSFAGPIDSHATKRLCNLIQQIITEKH